MGNAQTNPGLYDFQGFGYTEKTALESLSAHVEYFDGPGMISYDLPDKYPHGYVTNGFKLKKAIKIKKSKDENVYWAYFD